MVRGQREHSERQAYSERRGSWSAAVPVPFALGDGLVFNLNTPDFTTSAAATPSINAALGEQHSTVHRRHLHPRERAARQHTARGVHRSIAEKSDANRARRRARDRESRTGTVVIGRNVRVLPAAVSHGSLTVTITERAVDEPAERAFQRHDREHRRHRHRRASGEASACSCSSPASAWVRSCAP